MFGIGAIEGKGTAAVRTRSRSTQNDDIIHTHEQVLASKEEVKRMAAGHGGWDDGMSKVCTASYSGDDQSFIPVQPF